MTGESPPMCGCPGRAWTHRQDGEAQTEDGQERSKNVEWSPLGDRRIDDSAAGKQDGDDHDDFTEEDPAPRGEGGHGTTEQRSDRHGDGS